MSGSPVSTAAVAGRPWLRTTLMTMAAVLAASLIVNALIASAPAAVKHGKSYAAETKGGHVALVFSTDGRQVRRAYANYTYKCTDGEEIGDVDAFRSIPVSAARRFSASYDSGPVDDVVAGVVGRFTGMIKGRRSASGKKVTGTFRATFVATVTATGASLTCDTGTISYVARD